MKREVVIIGIYSNSERRYTKPGVIDSDFVTLAKECDDGVRLTMSTGKEIVVQGDVNDWLEDVPELWYVNIGDSPAVDGLGQPVYFHSCEGALTYIEIHMPDKGLKVLPVPEAARRWMMAGIRVW